jgi:hypothetical protein
VTPRRRRLRLKTRRRTTTTPPGVIASERTLLRTSPRMSDVVIGPSAASVTAIRTGRTLDVPVPVVCPPISRQGERSVRASALDSECRDGVSDRQVLGQTRWRFWSGRPTRRRTGRRRPTGRRPRGTRWRRCLRQWVASLAGSRLGGGRLPAAVMFRADRHSAPDPALAKPAALGQTRLQAIRIRFARLQVAGSDITPVIDPPDAGVIDDAVHQTP